MGHRFVTRRAPPQEPLRSIVDPDVLQSVIEDAAHYPGGVARSLVRPRNTESLSHFLATTSDPVLAIGAQSSLTGGATPRHDAVVDLKTLTTMRRVGTQDIAVGAGVVLSELQTWLSNQGLYYPPVPTFLGATLGGTVATNAAGAATFKYGATRPWVTGLTAVLADGEILEIHRGEVSAQDYTLERISSSGTIHSLAIPHYAMPRVLKHSSGYWASSDVDLIDVLIGSEGTLAIVTDVLLRAVPVPRVVTGLLFASHWSEARTWVTNLCAGATDFRASGGGRGFDLRSVESIDNHALELVRLARKHEELRIPLKPQHGAALLFEVEFVGDIPDQVFEDALLEILEGKTPSVAPEIGSFLNAMRPAVEAGILELAWPSQISRKTDWSRFRESVPETVNALIAQRKLIEPALHKLATDFCVPVEHLDAVLARQMADLDSAGLEHATWGHVSDGNLHVNVLPRNLDELRRGQDLFLSWCPMLKAVGGAPMAEHGTGRSALKQKLLHEYYGTSGIEEMRQLKRGFDPRGRLARDVLFPWTPV